MTAYTWSTVNSGFPAAISGGNLAITGTSAGTGAWYLTQGSSPLGVGKYYFEVTIGSNGNTGGSGYGSWAIGFTAAGSSLQTFLGGGSSSGYYAWTGGILGGGGGANNTTQVSGTVGSTICVAIDTTLSPPAYWVRNGAGNWNNNTNGSNPANGSAGITLTSGVTYLPTFLWAGNSTPLGSTVANFGATPFTYSPPSGFSALAPAAPTMSASPSSVIVSSTGNSLIVTGVSTSFSGSPFTLSGGTGASITSQSVAYGTSATVVINAGSALGTLTLTDTGSGATCAITVVATPTISVSPTTETSSTTGNVVTVAGSGTSFSGSPFTLSGGTGASITAQSVASGSSATVTISAGSTAGTLTLTDTGSGATASITVALGSSISLTPTSVTGDTAGNTVAVAGIGTSFSGSPFTVTGGYGARIVSQSVTSTTAGSLVLNTGAIAGNLTISDSGTGKSATLTIVPPALGVLNVGFIGDSITQGTNGNPVAAASAYLTALGYTVTVVNRGIAGTQTSDWAGGAIGPAITAFLAAGVTIVHCMLGTNDAPAPNSRTAAQHFASMRSVVQQLRAAGLQVVISKPLWTVPNITFGSYTWPNDPAALYNAYYALDMTLCDGVAIFQGDTSNHTLSLQSPGVVLEGAGLHPANSTENNIVGENWALAIVNRASNGSRGARWTHS